MSNHSDLGKPPIPSSSLSSNDSSPKSRPREKNSSGGTSPGVRFRGIPDESPTKRAAWEPHESNPGALAPPMLCERQSTEETALYLALKNSQQEAEEAESKNLKSALKQKHDPRPDSPTLPGKLFDESNALKNWQDIPKLPHRQVSLEKPESKGPGQAESDPENSRLKRHSLFDESSDDEEQEAHRSLGKPSFSPNNSSNTPTQMTLGQDDNRDHHSPSKQRPSPPRNDLTTEKQDLSNSKRTTASDFKEQIDVVSLSESKVKAHLPPRTPQRNDNPTSLPEGSDSDEGYSKNLSSSGGKVASAKHPSPPKPIPTKKSSSADSHADSISTANDNKGAKGGMNPIQFESPARRAWENNLKRRTSYKKKSKAAQLEELQQKRPTADEERPRGKPVRHRSVPERQQPVIGSAMEPNNSHDLDFLKIDGPPLISSSTSADSKIKKGQKRRVSKSTDLSGSENSSDANSENNAKQVDWQRNGANDKEETIDPKIPKVKRGRRPSEKSSALDNDDIGLDTVLVPSRGSSRQLGMDNFPIHRNVRSLSPAVRDKSADPTVHDGMTASGTPTQQYPISPLKRKQSLSPGSSRDVTRSEGAKSIQTLAMESVRRAEQRRNRSDTYTKIFPFAQIRTREEEKEFQDFLKDFNLSKMEDDVHIALAKYNDSVGRHFRLLVPSTVPPEDFWCRYFYRCDEKRILRELRAQNQRDILEQANNADANIPADLHSGSSVGGEKGLNKVKGLSNITRVKSSGSLGERMAHDPTQSPNLARVMSSMGIDLPMPLANKNSSNDRKPSSKKLPADRKESLAMLNGMTSQNGSPLVRGQSGGMPKRWRSLPDSTLPNPTGPRRIPKVGRPATPPAQQEGSAMFPPLNEDEPSPVPPGSPTQPRSNRSLDRIFKIR